MKLIIVLAAIGFASASDVLDLKDSNFAANVDLPLALVEFFAPWCGHCKRLAPEYEKAATELLKNDPPVPLIKVDCTENTETCKKYDVSGYPTLKIFRGGDVSEDYNGPRDAAGIVKHMASKAGPSVRVIEDVAAYNKVLENMDTKPVIFSFHEGDVPSEYTKSADGLSSKYKFYATNNADVIAKAEAKTNTVVLVRSKLLKNKFEPSSVELDTSSRNSKAKIDKFINDNANGRCGPMDGDNAEAFQKRPLITAFYNVDYVKDKKGTNYWRNRLLKVLSGDSKFDKFACSVANSVDFGKLVSDSGLDGNSDKPQVLLQTTSGKYPMTAEFNMDNFAAFLNDYLDDKLEPYLKSEPIPESNDDPVKVVVGKTFEEIVMDKSKDVLIEFYAPWCGHCKSLAPKYDELAEKYEGVDDVVIAKMDATANDVPPQFQVSGFPTLFWVPANNVPEKYAGGREVDDFVKFITKKRGKEEL